MNKSDHNYNSLLIRQLEHMILYNVYLYRIRDIFEQITKEKFRQISLPVTIGKSSEISLEKSEISLAGFTTLQIANQIDAAVTYN